MIKDQNPLGISAMVVILNTHCFHGGWNLRAMFIPRSHGTLIGALRDGGLSRHADDCEMDISERDVELLQSVAMKADVYYFCCFFLLFAVQNT